MRRPAPRPLAGALEEVTRASSPGGVLAGVQAAWPRVVGPAVAAEAEPVAENDGVVTVRCSDAVWAAELELLAQDLVARLKIDLERETPHASLRGLRFEVSSPRPARAGR